MSALAEVLNVFIFFLGGKRGGEGGKRISKHRQLAIRHQDLPSGE